MGNIDGKIQHIDLDVVKHIRQAVEDEEELYPVGNKRFPFGLIRAMDQSTPVVHSDKFHKVKWRYGIELEIDFYHQYVNGEEWTDFADHMAKLANAYLGCSTKPYEAGIVRDGTVDNGWEIVLAAMSIQKVLAVIGPIINDHGIASHIYPGGKAALHVTVDPFDTPKEQRAFHDFWDHEDLFKRFISIIGRDETAYCERRGGRVIKNPRTFMKPDTLRTHYNRCNVRNNGAMEVRVFKASYDIDTIHRQLKMVDAVNKAVRSGVYDYDGIRDFIKRGTYDKSN